MNNDIADIISQMDDRTFYQFLQTDFKDLTGREFLSQQIKNQGTQQLKERAINAVQLAEQPDEVKSRVISAYLTPGMKLSSTEVEQPQQGRSANVTGYSFDDDSYNAIAGEYDDYNTYDDRVPSTRNQGSAIQSQSVSQAPLDIAGVKKAIAQDPNWQPRNDYEKWAVGFLQGEEWTPNPMVAPANVNRNTGVPTPKAPNEKYQFNVLEDRENRTANVKNVPIPKPVGIRTDLQTGLVYDYNRGLVFNPATGVTQKLIGGGRTIPTKLEVPSLIQGEQSNFIPVPPIESRLDLDPNQDLSPQARQYLVDRQWNKDKEQAYIQQQQAVDNQLTSGENRFFGTANFSPKRDNSVPDEYKRFIGTSPTIAQVNQAYSPEVMSRVGQGGFLKNTGSILLPQTWIDKETGDTVFSRGRGTATTIVYKNDGKGGVIPMLSIPKADGIGNDLIELNDAVTRNIISPVDGKRIIGSNDGKEILSPIENKTIGTRNLITLGQLKAAKDIAAQTRFIPASGMDSFNRENVKLYEATDNSGNNYRATYMNPLTKEVFNVTKNGDFYLVRPAVNEEASGLPKRKGTTNLAQEMTDINRAMREGGRDNLVDIIREDPDNPGLEAFTRPVPAINPITGETINKYVHSRLEERFNPTTGQIEKVYVSTKIPSKWTDDNNPEDLFNPFWTNVQSQIGLNEDANDLARGGRKQLGGKITSAYPSIDDWNLYTGGELGFNPDGNIVDIGKGKSNVQIPSAINYLTPASEFYSSSPQVVRELVEDPVTGRRVAGRVLYSGQNLTSVRPQWIASSGRDGNTIFEEAYIPRTDLQTQNPVLRFSTNPQTPLRAFNVNEYGVPIPDKYGFPQKVKTSWGEPIQLPRSAQIANFQRGEDMRGAEAYPMLRKDADGNIQFVESPVRSGRRMGLSPKDWKGVIPDSASIPEGMSYDEAKDKGLLNPVWDKSRPFTALDSSYQIPLPKGLGLARVLDKSDPRTQAAIIAQNIRKAIPSLVQQRQSILADSSLTSEERKARVDELFAIPLKYLGGEEVDTLIEIAKRGESRPAFDRKYTITPGKTVGIESPQYAQYTDLLPKPSDDTAKFWKENIPGVVPQGVIDGAYLPVTVTPRPVDEQGKKMWLYPDHIYTTESGRKIQGKDANTFAYVPLNLDNGTTSYLPTSKRKELEAKGFGDDAINAWVNANPNLARDNALANAKILIDGQYYDVTPQATVPEFNPAAGGNYLQAVNRSEHRGARIDLPFKAGTNISEPTPEWIAQQAAKGNLAFNPDDYISPEDKVILNQKEIYNAGYEEPTDILGAINRTQQKKNRIDAVISNQKQRAMNNLNEQVGSVVDGNYTTLSPGMKVFNQDMLSNPEDLSSPISEDFVGPVQLIPDAQSPARKTFKGWQNYSNYLGDEINRASAAQNAIINIEDSPEITITRTGTYGGVKDFNQRAANELGMEVLDNRNPSYIVGYDNQERPLFESKAYGSLPNNLLPYQQVKALNETELLPAYRTQQKVELSTVPTSNVMNLGRVIPFPEEVITTQQIIPTGNQVVDITNNSVAIVPSSSRQSINPEVIDTPRVRRRNQTQGVVNDVFSMGNNTPNTPIEPDVRMTGGMSIPKWAIPATLGAVWLGLAANARKQQDEERRQQQGVGVR